MTVKERTPEAQAERQRLHTQEEPSHATGIADALVVKDGGLYFLCKPDGSVPLEDGHGLGLYFHDCRFLSGYELRIGDARPESLAATDEDGFRAIAQLTNPELRGVDRGISRQRIGIRWRHVLDARGQALHDELTIENYDTEPHELSIVLSFAGDFRDVFVIRGLVEDRPGAMHRSWEDGELVFSYEGGDDRLRELRITFSEPPGWTEGNRVGFALHLESHQIRTLVITLGVTDNEPERSARRTPMPAELQEIERRLERSSADWVTGFARVHSSSLWIEKTVQRSLRDLRSLRMTLDDHRFFAAGVPWFSTLFGRDSLLCALMTLAYRPGIAAETLRLLARFQGTQIHEERDEEPGKILHELRVGELARMGRIPYTPYYGTVDATPLFLILLGEYVRWNGDMSLFHELEGAVEAALRWISDHADHDGDGYIDYYAQAGDHLINQGWKDSGGAIVNSRGRRARAPVALVEVQGYVFLAKLHAAELFRRAGRALRATILEREAGELRARFDRDFWMPENQFYAMALEQNKQRVDAISSNVGQALWTGIIDDRARVTAVVERLMAEDMNSGWGIRTLSSREQAYNPIGYHLGTVWPHDNALIAAGFRRHGFDAEACRVFADLIHAAMYFTDNRLPEAFAGYPRREYGVPVRYPVACHPQAWAAGSIPYLLQVLMGLEPDGFEHRLRIVRPCLPSFVDRIELQHLRVGAAEVDLLFRRTSGSEVSVEVEEVRGKLDVQVEHGAACRLP